MRGSPLCCLLSGYVCVGRETRSVSEWDAVPVVLVVIKLVERIFAFCLKQTNEKRVSPLKKRREQNTLTSRFGETI